MQTQKFDNFKGRGVTRIWRHFFVRLDFLIWTIVANDLSQLQFAPERRAESLPVRGRFEPCLQLPSIVRNGAFQYKRRFARNVS